MLKYDFEEQSQSRLPSFYSFSPLHLPPLSIHTYTKIDSDDSSCHVSRHSRYSISSPIFFFFFFFFFFFSIYIVYWFPYPIPRGIRRLVDGDLLKAFSNFLYSFVL